HPAPRVVRDALGLQPQGVVDTAPGHRVDDALDRVTRLRVVHTVQVRAGDLPYQVGGDLEELLRLGQLGPGQGAAEQHLVLGDAEKWLHGRTPFRWSRRP